MFSRPLISVVVPAHNARLFIGETVSSIQRQTLGDWECVVIDDGSADGTFEEAQAAIQFLAEHILARSQNPVHI
jgi:glycosyltransferase involved in cell wall biosynthesis